jgi:hypothetical protein
MAIESLVLAKYLFQKGENSLNQSDSMACGLAISLFQDAAEIIIWTIAKELDAHVKDQEPFANLWDKIREAPKNKERKELPLKPKMLELNKIRVSFKHYGVPPEPSLGQKYMLYTEEFLRISIRTFFNKELDEVSMADLVRDEQTKKYIKEAEDQLNKNCFDKAVVACAKAESKIFAPFNSLLPEFSNKLTHYAPIFNRNYKDAAKSLLQNIEFYFDRLRMIGFASMANINMGDYLRFKSIIPSISWFANGSSQTYHRKNDYQEEEARFCIRFILDCALAVQMQVYGHQ